MGISSLLYNIGLGVYHAGIKLSAPFNTKAQQWVAGRDNWQQNLQSVLNGKPVIWVHCASLGEFEQGKPVIEALESTYIDKQVLVSFYSPSGYEVVKRKEPERAIVYLPADTDANAKQFVQLVNPTLAIFIKYEFWYHYLQYLRWHKVPTILVSGIFRPIQPFFKPWGSLHREMLACFSYFFVQDDESRMLLQGEGFSNVVVSGDTRFDRVVGIQRAPQHLALVEAFKADAPIFIAGSTWPADEEVLMPMLPKLIENGWKVIIAPHDIDIQHIKRLKQVLGDNATTYTDYQNEQDSDILIIDNVGLLASMYQYAELAYIGGGFGKGIHNTLEAAANGLPVVFGPNYQKFKEAKDLIRLGGAFSVDSFAQLQQAIDSLQDEAVYIQASQVAQNYVKDNTGGTSQVMEWVVIMA